MRVWSKVGSRGEVSIYLYIFLYLDLGVNALPAYILIFLLYILLFITLVYGVVGLGLEPPA
jgi:hypothetical protein